ncbi:CID domain-containing protein [Caerostris darwini]|uniref:CID domain-containing protein n=1 Tax=Caerostris darwini TaxID=1538125 RepID=A0AAV4T6H7_9ARAC|nr:CID domain-containing protein [Caerostris darwini]
MAKELNIEKLERKFASLTRSKESIQAVSSWMINHDEFYEEIVEQWFISLSRDINALTMFYVANEIIQSCGKRKAPQYRDAFAKVLEKAVCLEKVKEIKPDVCRLLSLWREREIYGEEFYQKVLNKLNNSEVDALSEEEDLSEHEIIKNYKLENLVNSLKTLKAVESEVREKEKILNSTKEPALPDLDELIVKNQFGDVIRNFDSYAKVLEDNIKASMEEIGARKQLLKELNSSCIYYASEQKDAKVVHTAYSMYGKKLNTLDQKLAEKMALFSSSVVNNSQCSTENSTITTPYQDTTVSRSSSTVTSLIPLEPGASFLDKFSKEPTSDSSKSVKEKYDESGLENSECLHKQKFNKLAELYTEGKPGYDQMSTCPLREISKPSSYEKSILSPLYDMDTKSKNDFDLKIKIAKYQKTEEKVNFIHKDLNVLNKPVESSNLETKSIFDEKRNVTKKIENISAIEDINEIDILLEESFDNKTSKLNISHGNLKKKIENLLKAKKVCSDLSFKQNCGYTSLPSSVKNSQLKRKRSFENTEDKEHVKKCNSEIETNQKEISGVMSKNIISNAFSHIKQEKTLSDNLLITNSKNSTTSINLSAEQTKEKVSGLFARSDEGKLKKNYSTNKNSFDLYKDNIDFITEDKPATNADVTNKVALEKYSNDFEYNDTLLQVNRTFIGSNLLASKLSEYSKNTSAKNIQKDCEVKSHEGNDSVKINFGVSSNNLAQSTEFPEKLNDAKIPLINSIFGNTSYSEQNIPFLENATEETSQLFKNNKVGTSFIDSQLETHDQTTDETQPITSSSVDSSNLLQTIQSLLHCISKKQFTGFDTKESAPHMSLEMCLTIYKALLAKPEYAKLATLPNIVQKKSSCLSNVKQEKGFTPLAVKQEKGFTPIAVKQEKGFTPIAVKQEKGFTPIAVKQEKDFTPIAVKQEKGFTPIAVKQEKDFTPIAVKQEKDFTPIAVKQEKDFTPIAVKQENIYSQSSIQLEGISSPPITVSSYTQPKKLSYATCVQQILNRTEGTVWRANSTSSSTSITDNKGDNFEVMDMECDSDEE